MTMVALHNARIGLAPQLLALLFGMVAVVLFVVLWAVCLRKHGQSDQCTSCVEGTVIGSSAINYAGHHIPLVRYEVNGREYKVAGPKFEQGTAYPGAICNVLDPAHPPVNLVAPAISISTDHMSNDRLYALSPLSRVYPVGSSVAVWYDPADPSVAYVIRPVREGYGVARVLLVLIVMFAVAAAASAVLAAVV